MIERNGARNRTEQNITTMIYNSLSRKTQMTDPDMGTWSYTYDKAGNLLTQTDARGQTTTFTYDEIGRVITKVSDITVTSVYDDVNVPYSKGKLTSLVSPGATDTIEQYDIMERVKRSTKTITGSPPQSATMEKDYDTAGRVVALRHLSPTARTIT